MDFAILLLVFLFGLLFGSFFNVVGLRVPQEQSLLAPPSHCPTCKKQLKPIDLIPILSYLIARGKCRYCRAPISPVYPLIELATGILFAAVYAVYDFTPVAWLYLLFISLLVIITVSDLAYRIIPDKVLLPFFLVFLVLRFFIHPDETYLSHLIGMVLGFTIFYIIAIVSGNGIGGGDIKLFAVVGLFLGYPLLLLTILLSTFFGAFYGVLLMIFRGAGRKTKVPFGPFIALGALLALFKGYDLIAWYFSFFY
ncbi:prepilin peptidase [Aneurinibacillus thermoaerophilus]|uniref:Prepilin leader peptidase/N-methyltransferase n=1 Tax=Aneurinibacillus thermoaerophilus TaxID=143495 RepID=A0A1G7ZRZ2_ANETH|nr:A24 family peptidase [Aneurinibacillus thermoaerophilus]MED0676400.1 prepilin peptidase [Aneurinibacillus thermoaerophilus]MED0755952.1 prepilin peptidase [Aneurinibacillus thermoaerophilus]MED0759724.1 prepilin peptidase [Aneurinibacillus thermoaerophilus]SDH11455.1 type 4 prepilin peptidase 1 Aspartic peptidase. MEROPS family A24A [Aneurinibacillus thermoaerophilus]